MPKKKAKSAKAKAPAASVDLQHAPQSVAAWLCGVPAVWLRDHPELPGRDSRGRWHVPTLVAHLRANYVATDFSDAELEKVLALIDQLEVFVSPGPLLDEVRRLLDSLGASGYAALGKLMLAAIEEDARENREPPTDDEVEARLADQRDREFAYVKQQRAIARGECRAVCEHCQRVRHGREWRERRVPKGSATEEVVCPACNTDEARKRRERRQLDPFVDLLMRERH